MHVARRDDEVPFETSVRFRTIGDATCTAAVESTAVHGRRHRGRDERGPAHRARRHPRRRSHLRGGHGRPQAPGLLLIDERVVAAAQRRLGSGGGPNRSGRDVYRHDRRPAPLHFATIGSVDDGKSTLIGRLLHDSKSIFEDQLAHIEAISRRRGDDYVDLALLTDGLRAEREQGITIDVAYRYFSTPHRDFVIADCPGHVQYTRNMVTGVSRAELAIVLVDARHGVVDQTRRHCLLASLLGVPHVVVAINKMDLVSHGEERFDEIVAEVDRVGRPPRGRRRSGSCRSRR